MSALKVNNLQINQDSRMASLPHLAFARQIQQHRALHYVAPAIAYERANASATKRYAPPCTQADMHCRISS